MTDADHISSEAGTGKKIPDLTDNISLTLTHADELLRCALDGIELSTPCDSARAKLRQIENLLMIAQEKVAQLRRYNLDVFKIASRENAA